MTDSKFRRFAFTARPGERRCYFSGDLARLRARVGPRAPQQARSTARDANLAYELAAEGWGHLFQRRAGDDHYEYIYMAAEPAFRATVEKIAEEIG